VTVQAQEFADQVTALGTLRAWESVDISASIAQKITGIYFDDGQQVTRGDVLATLKQDEEQATLRELQASLVDARREVRRLENLAKKNQVAQTELDKARTLEEVTGHRIEEVQARLADHTIVAPFSGVLGLRQVSEGALVVPGQRLTTLDDISRMRLEFSVPATRLKFLEPGGQVRATTPSFNEEFAGVITAIDSRIDPVARSIIARAELDNPRQLLRPGLLMEVTLVGAPRRTLLVPEESLQSRGSQHYLWKLEGDLARRIAVEIGGRAPGWVEIARGLQAGDQVVRDGVGMLSGEAAAVFVVEN
jgi:membrane fusion protein (multidrug efflux system)